jgi:ligand-binding sensor domain-containing protein
MSKQTFIRTLFLTAISAATFVSSSLAQGVGGPAVGRWRSFLPYGEVNGIVTDGSTFFCSTNSGFFTYDRSDGTLTGYSKETGMNDVELSGVAYDALTGKTVLAYKNSNIDVFKDGGFVNMPYLKSSQSSEDKTIHNIIASNGIAYLSTGVGLILLNLNKDEFKETIVFYDSTLTASVVAATVDETYLYAATSIGLFRINKSNEFIQNYLFWEKLDNKVYSSLSNSNNHIYLAAADSLFELSPGGLPLFKSKVSYPILHLDPEYNGSGVWVSVSKSDGSDGYCILKKEDGTVADSFFTVQPSQVVQLGNGDVWFGDKSGYTYASLHGLRKKTSVNQSEAYYPVGPVTNTSFDVTANNGELWVAHGGKNYGWGRVNNRAMFSHFTGEKWDNFPYVSSDSWFQDFIRVLKDPNNGKVYFGSFAGGVVERNPSGEITTYRGPEYFSPYAPPSNTYLISGLAMDDQRNLWITNYGGAQELVVKTADNKWYKMNSVDENSGHTAADVTIDDNGYKWFIAPGSGGVVVYNDNGTIENTADDSYRIFKAGKGAGGLPDNTTMSIVKDKDGAIWVGTANGIGIITCGSDAFSHDCESYLKPYQDDQFAGYLFQGQSVKAMAVDGANRKWIGTNNGVFLLSADAEKIIFKFTEENSPLLSNVIERINIDPVNGDVYFSTDRGLISYRSTATEGHTTNDDQLFVYPNPVPSNYNGMVAIRGMAENSDVRITDISGQLIYKTKANGGQAVWNGMDYTGHKAQSGVYIVFAVNKDGTQKATTKFILHR